MQLGSFLEQIHLNILNKRYALHIQSAQPLKAAQLCKQFIRRYPNRFPVYDMWSQAVLRGPDYLKILDGAHKELKPKTYVEIGVEFGRSLQIAALNGALCLGIDPEPKIKFPSEAVRIFALTSDKFFENYNLVQELRSPLDLAFIDGMHKFEFALRDFLNLEKYSHPSTVIFVHDVFPLDEASSTRERRTFFWTGDVWRLILCLKKYRPDLIVQTLDCPPSGLGKITNLNPNSTESIYLKNNINKICTEFLNYSFADLAPQKNLLLNVVAASGAERLDNGQ
jgi:hypothetical protein